MVEVSFCNDGLKAFQPKTTDNLERFADSCSRATLNVIKKKKKKVSVVGTRNLCIQNIRDDS
jgi:hypothetical protein